MTTLPELAAEARRMAEKHRNASDAPYTNGATHQRAHADAADDFCRLAAMAERAHAGENVVGHMRRVEPVEGSPWTSVYVWP